MKNQTPMAYPDKGPRTLSPREVEAIDAQCITHRYPDDWNLAPPVTRGQTKR